jgi:hypothetical protein
MRSCNWSCRSGLPTKDAVLAQRQAWRDRAQTGPSMRSASASEEKRWIMGQHRGVRALSLTSSDALLKESFEYRQRPLPISQLDDFTIRKLATDTTRQSTAKLQIADRDAVLFHVFSYSAEHDRIESSRRSE